AGAVKGGRDIAVRARAGAIALGSAEAKDDLVLRATGDIKVAGTASAQGGADGVGTGDRLFNTDRTKLNGELQLGDGALGTGTAFLVLADRALSHNRLSLSGAVAGQRVIGRLPDLAASRATFELLGRQGTTGPVTASIEFHVTGLSSAAPSMMLMAHRMAVQRLALGPDPLSPLAGRGGS
ncbi:MAG: hypothetical protein ACJ8G7_00750, partial [Rhizobacter sp.]